MSSKKRAEPGGSESEPDVWMAFARKRQELSRQREKQFEKVVEDTHAELEKLLAHLEENKKKQRQEAVKEQAKHVTTIIENVERRKKIEIETQKILTDVRERAEEVEQMTVVGYDGRLEAMNKALEAGQRARRRPE